MSSLLEDATSTLNELLRMYELNQELLETLAVTIMWIKDYAEKHNIPLPREASYQSLINKSQTLIEEIASSDSFIRRKVTETKSDEEVPEPARANYSFVGSYS